ncbi:MULTISPECIES: hypothetical protein [Culturomica]|jgi:hypothetical protein|uniref:hypothetical protein n=1 Tax=Culturomica TaxID=1926651 RepID=UPI0003408195|nr:MULTISPECIES: hypothetical protein [Odoribacteraceae]RHV93166.1 hypothetical protein DXA95_10940 [Odoribacter sp. OF09-27XD]CCZ06112.1 putative uncharacterized protein [Odoribacter sp. CAG:788]HBO26066.1 hypothetical protein [Culturomica sp.]
MASIRRLKKDIDYLTFSVVGDCFNYAIVTGKNNPQVSEIVKNIIATRNDLRDRIGAAGKLENKKEVKKHFNRIFGDLLVSVDKAFTELSEAIKKED